MSKLGKTILNILSWIPLVWTALILIATYFCSINQTVFSIFNKMADRFFWYGLSYFVHGGIFIWLALTILLTRENIITKRQNIINIILMVAGILSAYLSWHFNIFGVAYAYID